MVPAIPSMPAPGDLDRLLRYRRSTRSYASRALSAEALRELLRTALHRSAERRAYGSAHARYGVAVTTVAGSVDGLDSAAYVFDPESDELLCTRTGDHRQTLAAATYDADWLSTCPAVLVLSADLASANAAFAAQHPEKGTHFCYLEAGLISQNVHLWAAENSLGTVIVAGLRAEALEAPAMRALLPASHSVLGMLPIGHPAR